MVVATVTGLCSLKARRYARIGDTDLYGDTDPYGKARVGEEARVFSFSAMYLAAAVFWAFSRASISAFFLTMFCEGVTIYSGFIGSLLEARARFRIKS